MHSTTIRLQQAQELRARQVAEAAEHRLGLTARAREPHSSFRRTIGRSLIRLGRALAAEPEPALQPARPR